MFNLHDFVLRTLSTMKNKLDEYQVRSYALSWYSKSVLTDEDMATIDGWYADVETTENAEQTAESEEI